MSASVLHPPTSSREWLPMPIDDTEDFFARDLIRQFDKKQSRLRHEMAEFENSTSFQSHIASEEEHQDDIVRQPSTIHTDDNNDIYDEAGAEDEQQQQQQQQEPAAAAAHAYAQKHTKFNIVLTDQQQRSRAPSPPDSLHIEDHPEPPQPEPPPTPPSPTTTINRMRQGTAAAGDLLRRSSAFLRSKFLKSVTRAEETNGHPLQQQQHFDSAMPPPAKIAINTTISIPHHPPAHHANIKPPIITHYPPRPLKYSPVQPLENEPRKNALHRISLPVLTRATFHPEKRRLSDTTKAKIWLFFRPSKKPKGKESAGPGLS